jgi:hypothetical protein
MARDFGVVETRGRAARREMVCGAVNEKKTVVSGGRLDVHGEERGDFWFGSGARPTRGTTDVGTVGMVTLGKS